MLNRKAIAFFVLMLLAFDISYSLLSTCQPISIGQTANDGHQNHCTAFGGLIPWVAGIALHPFVTFLETYEHALIAGFTIILALFTGSLWFSTEKLWTATKTAAEQSERALTHLEAPFLSVKIIEEGITRSYGETGHHFHTLRLVIANFGRTPARIIEMADKAAFVEKNEGLPPEINPAFASRNSIPYGVIAPPQGESQGWSYNLFTFTLRYLVEGGEPLRKNELFYYGFIRYATIFDEIFRVGFCFMFDIVSEKWILTGGDRHNYHRKETEFYPPPMY